jgi:hypothetical protein
MAYDIEVEEVRYLFVAVIERAFNDVLNDPEGKTVHGRSAHDWFWSRDFDGWCNMCGWEPTDYKFRGFRKAVQEIRAGRGDEIKAKRRYQVRAVSERRKGRRSIVGLNKQSKKAQEIPG